MKKEFGATPLVIDFLLRSFSCKPLFTILGAKKQRSDAQSEDLGNRENALGGKDCHATSPTTAWSAQQKSSSLMEEDNEAHCLHNYIFAVGLYASSSNLQIAANVFSSTALRHLLTTIGMDKQYLHTGPFTFSDVRKVSTED